MIDVQNILSGPSALAPHASVHADDLLLIGQQLGDE